jgi:hypothetical protein
MYPQPPPVSVTQNVPERGPERPAEGARSPYGAGSASGGGGRTAFLLDVPVPAPARATRACRRAGRTPQRPGRGRLLRRAPTAVGR